MGGGEGAKERRRLKRLQQNENGVAVSSPATDNHGSGRKPTTIFKKVDKKRDLKGNSFVSRKKDGKGSSSGIKQSPVKKKSGAKFQKPKHMKRKLEQSAAEENEEARDALLDKIRTFQQKKQEIRQQRSTRRKPTRKKQSTRNVEEYSTTRIERDVLEIPAPPVPARTDYVEQEIEQEAEIDTDGDSDMAQDPDKAKDTQEAHSDADSDSDGGVEDQRRQRGRRRRGRKSTSQKIEENLAAEEEKVTEEEGRIPASEEGKPMEAEDRMPASESSTQAKKFARDDPARKLTPNGTERYCIGRKPVTDFVMGTIYKAKVVYVKPFGVFFDIGCHSDAFCHVSRLRDDFVENPERLFRAGDEVDARVVEIDRKNKRLTVSLQSEARIADEKKSIEARKNRKEKRKSKSKKRKLDTRTDQKVKTMKRDEGEDSPATPPTKHFAAVQSRQQEQHLDPKTHAIDPSIMTPAELKRARKLARRAARREQDATEEVQAAQ